MPDRLTAFVTGCFVLLVFVSAVIRIVGPLRGAGSAFPYKARAPFLSAAEKSFYGVLKLALADRFDVFAKVRVADIIDVRSGLSRRSWWRHFARISSKHVDFVICDRSTVELLGVIELDDSSHNKPDRIRRDSFLNSAFLAAGVKILRVKAARSYSAEDVRFQVVSMFVGPQNVSPPPLPAQKMR